METTQSSAKRNNHCSRSNQFLQIDFMEIIGNIIEKWWLVLIAAIIGAAVGFCYAQWSYTPQYSSSALLYINNKFSVSSSLSLSYSDIVASQNLVKTYSIILNNRTTLERILEKSGADYSYSQLSGMMSSTAIDDTSIMKVTVTCGDPYQAATIVNSIAEVLPERVSEIIDGASVRVVDAGVVNTSPITQSSSSSVIFGLIVGAGLVCVIIFLITVSDNTIKDENYLIDKYDLPLLAAIPDIAESKNEYYYRKKGHYYRKYSNYDYNNDTVVQESEDK